MPRTARLKLKNEEAYYHVISRTIHKQYLLGEVEKEKLVSLIKNYQELYFVKIIGYCIMSNHFHLLIKMETNNKYTDEEIQERVERFYGKPFYKVGISIEKCRAKLENLSDYVKQIKQTFSWWYNRKNNQTGTFWSERFKSNLVEEGESLLKVLSYIDLNPVRAKIVQKPETYRHSSIGYRYQTENKDGTLTYDGINLIIDNNISKKEQNNFYLKLLYSVGYIKASKDNKKETTLTKRIRYMTDGIVIGSESFIQKAYTIFGGSIIKKKERKAHKTGISTTIFSIRNLRE